jgi:hypothetical protein
MHWCKKGMRGNLLSKGLQGQPDAKLIHLHGMGATLSGLMKMDG